MKLHRSATRGSYQEVAEATIVESRTSKSKIVRSIVIPAYNEASRIPTSLPKLLEVIDLERDEIIVVDDGSTDETGSLAGSILVEVPNFTLLRLASNQGKGAAVRSGVGQARGSIIAFADADMASSPSGLDRLFERLEFCEVALGSRSHPDSTINCADPGRILFGRVFNRFVRSVSGLEILDTQCGFKAFRGPAAKLLFHLSRIQGYAFDVEILMLASKLTMRIQEVPVDWTDVKGSHVRPLIHSAPMAADVMRSVANWRSSMPVQALSIQSNSNGSRMGPGEVVTALRASVRYSDPIITWPRGALCLLPGLDASIAKAIKVRLEGRLSGCKVTQSLVSTDMLVHPAASPILNAFRAIPDPVTDEVCVVCDDRTARELLQSLGVA